MVDRCKLSALHRALSFVFFLFIIETKKKTNLVEIDFIDTGSFMFYINSLTLSQTNPGFYMPAVEVFRKHCGKKEKLLVTSNFSFSHSVFYQSGIYSANLIKFEIVVGQLFQFGRV